VSRNAHEEKLRKARRQVALASFVLIVVCGAAFLLLARSAEVMGLERGDAATYGLFAVAVVLLWLASLPAIDRLACALALAPRRPRRRVIRAIRRGLERGEFELHFQPQIDLDTGRPIAVEALLRWRRQSELLLPGRFLTDAESNEIIGPVTSHVLDLALAQAGKWQRSGRELPVSVNLSAASLRSFAIVERVQVLLEQHGVSAQMLTLEVTETAVLHEPELARAVLDALSSLGVSISIDDFGTGYSSLLWLRLFPVDQVKIDRTFIADTDGDGEAFVAGVIRLGQSLGLDVVAEGVEDDRVLKRLQELGCDLAQGWHFAPALPAREVEAWIDDGSNVFKPMRREIALSGEGPSLDDARRLIEEAAAELGYDDEAIWDMKLAATEALMNAIEHGRPSEDGMVHLRLAPEHGDLLLEVWGGSIEEPSEPSPAANRGRGIAIMTALMDEVELKRNPQASRILLAKRRSPAGTVDG
jgi:EAL domain-containing protein (putative c-di-GMP-specific phosphodiesterase class I)/anti-sigma regulatory factor (Ser/Thr protein kinase)